MYLVLSADISVLNIIFGRTAVTIYNAVFERAVSKRFIAGTATAETAFFFILTPYFPVFRFLLSALASSTVTIATPAIIAAKLTIVMICEPELILIGELSTFLLKNVG